MQVSIVLQAPGIAKKLRLGLHNFRADGSSQVDIDKRPRNCGRAVKPESTTSIASNAYSTRGIVCGQPPGRCSTGEPYCAAKGRNAQRERQVARPL